MTSVEERYRLAEQVLETKRLARQRRQPLILIALFNVLVIGVGTTAVLDLRRLHTPGGTALKWTEAAVFGVCDDYLSYSVADPSVSDSRPSAQLCKDLRASTEATREQSGKVGLRLQRVTAEGTRATAQLLLTRDDKDTPLSLQLQKRDGRWKVVRNTVTCGSVGCP